ncbi:hypothetical protein QFC19_008017 [Naganishia cerealis]|uniref:Uncharacterized protein n=1 Tax=Naganishia cerealis TaxID=610337 RepID=A0ACC2V6Q5_9TREE|nr:hypothetical protein QFC19_008017 [Naganishia cerealis]
MPTDCLYDNVLPTGKPISSPKNSRELSNGSEGSFLASENRKVPVQCPLKTEDITNKNLRQAEDGEKLLGLEDEEDEDVECGLENGANQSVSVSFLSILTRRFFNRYLGQAHFVYTNPPDFAQRSQWDIRRSSLTPLLNHLSKKAGSKKIKITGSLVAIVFFMALTMSTICRSTFSGSGLVSPSGWETVSCSNISGQSSVPTRDVLSPYYHLFNISSLPKAPISAGSPIPLQKPAHLPLDHGCLEEWFATGNLCTKNIGVQNSVDLVYLWVNGSDPIWQQQYNRIRRLDLPMVTRRNSPEPPLRHYRSQGSFKYALRSGVEAFNRSDKPAESWVRKVHVLTADMPVHDREDIGLDMEDERLGQIPDWLDKERIFGVEAVAGFGPGLRSSNFSQARDLERRTALSDGQPSLQWHFHSEVFRSPILQACAPCTFDPPSRFQPQPLSEQEWVKKVMPSFNSFNIENRMAWLDDLSEYSVQVNDDMFFGTPLSSADFHSTLYGSVFRLDRQFGLQVKPILMPSKVSDNGEWGGLQHANWLISQRFPLRPRNYLDHLPKAIGAPILQEASIIFAPDLSDAAQRHFRESTYGVGDISMAFLITHMRIERWREALLWSWTVARLGAREEGMWGERARNELQEVLGLDGVTLASRTTLQVRRSERDTLKDVPKRFAQAKWEPPLATSFHFCMYCLMPRFGLDWHIDTLATLSSTRIASMDGHLPRIPDDRLPHDDIDECKIDLYDCFGSAFLGGDTVSSADMFKRLAFERYQCGDCLIMALVNRSGKRGLSAFLPDKDQVVASSSSSLTDMEQPPHLPLTKSWEATDFALGSVLKAAPGTERDGQVNLRTWTVLLLSRYMYISGVSPSHFASLKQPLQAADTFTYLRQNPQLGMICLNDDEADDAADKIGGLLHDWLEERWGGIQAWWERGES